MRRPLSKSISPFACQRGLATVEFALVGLMFLVLVFGVLELGRALFVWNAVAEATRLGARAAAVCPMGSGLVPLIARYNNGEGRGPLPAGLTAEHIEVTYLTQDGTATTNPNNTRFVRVQIADYVHELLIPGIASITLPPFATTRPRESLGIVPADAVENGDPC